ncbi:MAG: homocysteine S-methyltransferase [Olegusella sp.]|nr:homocysteine S-methyltransferase [Olegusella sp.]
MGVKSPTGSAGAASGTGTVCATGSAGAASATGVFAELWEQTGGKIVLDGPMGTELELRGYDVNDALWSAKYLSEDPSAIKRIHRDYIEAGADIVTCASYQGSVPGFMDAGYSQGEAERLIALSALLAQEARDEWWAAGGSATGRHLPLVAGDVGPYGAYLADGSEYTGDYELTEAEYRDFHLRRMKVLAEAGVDLYAVETMPRLDEALACAHMLEELGADYWLSFTYRNDHQISNGTELADVVAAVRDLPHLQALGVNCTPPEYVETIARGIRALCDVPVCAYPNSGETYDGHAKCWHEAPAGEGFGDYLPRWADAGVALIGGCCRTRPADIERVARLLRG